MNTKKHSATMLALAVALVWSACGNVQDTNAIKVKVESIEAQQRDILTKLDALAAGQKKLLAKAPAAAARPQAADPNKVYKLVIGKSATKGPGDAPVTIVEFSDFQCPFCSRAAKLVEQITEAYPKDVRFVYKNFPLPFHREAMPAAKAAVAAGKQGKFWQMHDRLFANQRSLAPDFYEKAAAEISLDVERFKRDMASSEVEAQINQEMKEARAASVRGTPTFYINGKKPQGRSFELYKTIIDGILKKKRG